LTSIVWFVGNRRRCLLRQYSAPVVYLSSFHTLTSFFTFPVPLLFRIHNCFLGPPDWTTSSLSVWDGIKSPIMSSRRPSQIHPDFMGVSTDSQEPPISPTDDLIIASPLSGIQGAVPLLPRGGDFNLSPSPTKRAATAPASPQRSPKRISTETSPSVRSVSAQLESGFHPNEFDFAISDVGTLNPTKTAADAAAIAEFLTAMEKQLATPPEQRRTPPSKYSSLSLIQQQLIAGIPIGKLEPMSGVGSRQSQGPPRLFNTPSALTYFNDATYIPAIPPAQFNGKLNALPIHPSLPNPPWMDRSSNNGNQCAARPVTPNQDLVTSTGSPTVNTPQTPDNPTNLSATFHQMQSRLPYPISTLLTSRLVLGSSNSPLLLLLLRLPLSLPP
jgi:hypothetical protein